nr:peptidoglycan editing factor PgeF [Kineosphaera limosa]
MDWGFTSASGGRSRAEAAYGNFNLGGHVGDDPQIVETNRRELATAFGVARDHLLFLAQTHGTNVVLADGPWPDGQPAEADAIVTTNPDVALAVLVADCVPLLLADPQAGVVAAVHAGRPGMINGIVPRTIEVMREAGAQRIEAAIGPSVCGRCYEVPQEMRDEAAATSAVSATVSWTGTPAIDVAAGVVDQLRAHDVPVTWIPGCTRESESLYSYRRRQTTGRSAGVVRRWAP